MSFESTERPVARAAIVEELRQAAERHCDARQADGFRTYAERQANEHLLNLISPGLIVQWAEELIWLRACLVEVVPMIEHGASGAIDSERHLVEAGELRRKAALDRDPWPPTLALRSEMADIGEALSRILATPLYSLEISRSRCGVFVSGAYTVAKTAAGGFRGEGDTLLAALTAAANALANRCTWCGARLTDENPTIVAAGAERCDWCMKREAEWKASHAKENEG